MAKTDFKTIDEYITTFDGEDVAGLQAIRKAILSAVPDAEERISYQIPAFHHRGWIFYISAHKQHFNLSCPPPSAAFEAFKDELAQYNDKGCRGQFRNRNGIWGTSGSGSPCTIAAAVDR